MVGGAATEAEGDGHYSSAEEREGNSVLNLTLSSGVTGVSVETGTVVVNHVAMGITL